MSSETMGLHKACNRFDDKNYPVVKAPLSEEELKAMFRRYDTNRDGLLSKKELKEAFQSLGSRFPAWRAWRARCFADSNGDGFISHAEFESKLVKYLVKHGYARNKN